MSGNDRRLRGEGTVVTKAGKSKAVHYELQEDTPLIVITAKLHRTPTIPSGHTSTYGTITPVCFRDESELTLELSDGRKLRFTWLGDSGSILLLE